MKPSKALELHRDEVRRLVEECKARNPRIFGSVLHGRDGEDMARRNDAEGQACAAEGFRGWGLLLISNSLLLSTNWAGNRSHPCEPPSPPPGRCASRRFECFRPIATIRVAGSNFAKAVTMRVPDSSRSRGPSLSTWQQARAGACVPIEAPKTDSGIASHGGDRAAQPIHACCIARYRRAARRLDSTVATTSNPPRVSSVLGGSKFLN